MNLAALATPSQHTARYLAAKSARAAYEDAVTSDGVSVNAWLSIAAALAEAADGLRGTGATPGQIQCLADRARDAAQRAQYATRMLAVARMSRKQIIPVVGVEVRP